MSRREIETGDPVTVLKNLSPDFPAVVRILPGTYTVPSGGIHLRQLRNVTILADQVVFLTGDPQSRTLLFEQCTDVTVRGLTIDYDPLPFTQATLTAVDYKAYTADFTVHDGYPDLTEPYLAKRFHLFEAGQPRWKEGAPDYYVQQVERLDARTGRIHLLNEDPGIGFLASGDRVVFNIRDGYAVKIANGCKDITLENVTIHAAPGAAVMVRYAENTGIYKNLKVIPGPTPDGTVHERLMSTGADGFNAAYTRTGPLLDGCEFAYMGDDSVNLHGLILPVLLFSDSQTFIAMRPGSEPFEAVFRRGDNIRFLTAPDYRLIGQAEVQAVTRDGVPENVDWLTAIKEVWPSFKSGDAASFYRVALETGVDFERMLSGGGRIFFESFAAAPTGYVIQNNSFRDHRGRGLRLMAGNGVVHSNYFARIKGAAISAGPSFAYWKEAGWVENITIRDNMIYDAGHGRDITDADSYTLGAISIFAEVVSNGFQTVYYAGNRNLNIINNTIDGCSVDGINVVAANDVLVESNTIRRVNQRSISDAGSAYGLRYGQAVTVQYSTSTTVQDNNTGSE